jgi:ATP-dependent DNA ligase
MPLETRKATLASLLKPSGVIRLSEHIVAEGPDVFACACKLGAEVIVSRQRMKAGLVRKGTVLCLGAG